MEPEGSLPHSEEPVRSPFSELDKSSPRPHLHFFKMIFNISLRSTPWSSKWTFFFSNLFTKTLSEPLLPPSHPYVLHAPPISFFLICITRIMLGEHYGAFGEHNGTFGEHYGTFG